MYQGRFPESRPDHGRAVPYVPGSWSRAELDPDPSVRTDRRQWLVAGAGMLAGIALAPVWSLLARGAVADRAAPAGNAGETKSPGPVPGRRAPDWALALLGAPGEKLVSAAGDLERVSFTSDPRLVPVFERLLDTILADRGLRSDHAGACAVRSLARLGRFDVVASRETLTAAASDLPLTTAAIGAELERQARELRRGQRR